MLYAEIQFNRPMKLPSMVRSGTRLTDVEAEPSEAGLLIGRAFVPWVHVLFTAAPPFDRPNEGAPVSVSSDQPARRGNSKRAGQPDKP